MKEFDQTNVKHVLKELTEEAKRHDSCKGVATCGLATVGKAWLVFFIVLIMFCPNLYSQPPTRRYIYNHPYYRSVTPSYNHTYVQSYRNYQTSSTARKSPYYSNRNRGYSTPYQNSYQLGR